LSLYVIPRNWTRKSEKLSRADAYLVSVPKSGRTWLRFFLRHYLCAWADVPFTIDPSDDEPHVIPRVVASHDLWEHLTTPSIRDRARGRYLIPPSARRSRKIILAVRDLPDVMVSLHLQLTRRGFRSGAAYEGNLSEMIRDRRFGAKRTVAILNHWLDEWRGSGRLHVFRYEDCRKDPGAAFTDLLRFLNFDKVDEALLAASIEFASFDSMKQMERENRFDRKILKPGDADDPESFKVRRGVVGGFVDYLSDEDAHLLEVAAAKLRL
jgi:hypothetical protein